MSRSPVKASAAPDIAITRRRGTVPLTAELRAQLLANGRAHGTDHVPVVKFFNPIGGDVWLASELDPDGDTLFGLADLGEPVLGHFSLEEVTARRLPLGLGIERDIFFSGQYPLSVWASAARETGSIRSAEWLFQWARQPRREGL